MILPKGRYKAKVTSAGLQNKGPNGLLVLSVYFSGYEWKDGDEYVPLANEDGSPVDAGIIHDFYIVKKDGTLNSEIVKRMCEVFEWEDDFTTLEQHVVGRMCKITVDEEEYRGKMQHKVQWVNHIDDGDGGYEIKPNPALAAAAHAKWGASVRAMASGKPNPAAAKPAAKPAPRPAAPAPPRAPSATHTLESIYMAFEARANEEMTDSHGNLPQEKTVHDNWWMFLESVYGHRDGEAVTDWALAAQALPDYTNFIPF